MAGQLEVCNLALVGLLGEVPLTAVDEGTVPAQVCRVVYPTLRDSLLEAAWWRFATVRARLGRLDALPPQGYQFYYGLTLTPPCLRVEGVSPVDDPWAPWEAGWTEYPYRLELARVASTLQRAVATNLESAAAWYIARVDEGLFSGLFTQALATALAVQLCTALSGKASLLQRLVPLADRALQEAKGHDSHQDTPRHMAQNPRYVAARLQESASVFQVGPVSAPWGQPLGVSQP
jgi:hypothetical protein